MPLSVHPSAQTAFDSKAESLVSKLQMAVPTGMAPEQHVGPDTYLAGTLTDREIVKFGQLAMLTPDGEEAARLGHLDGEPWSLEGEAHRAFVKLAENMQRTSDLRDVLTEDTLRDQVFQWLMERRVKRVADAMTTTVLVRCQSAVVERTILIPVCGLHLEREFELGHVCVRTVRRQELEGWLQHAITKFPNQEPAIRVAFAKLAQQYQGKAATQFTTVAEPKRAFERALEATEYALAALRVLSGATTQLERRSYCVPAGREHAERDQYIVLQDGHYAESVSGVLDPACFQWTIPTAQLDALHVAGAFDAMNRLLTSATKTDFQQKLFDALVLYARSALHTDIAAKLTYTLAALESLLLRNDSEPIAENLSTRMAFLVGPTITERRAVVKTVRDTYAVRSQFIHHGAHIADRETVKAFLTHAWRTFAALVASQDKFTSRDALLNMLDERKLA
jgi:Apea-like HEPN